jgi:hypothetical protein
MGRPGLPGPRSLGVPGHGGASIDERASLARPYQGDPGFGTLEVQPVYDID